MMARGTLSRTAKVLGWLSVAVVVAAMGWSLWTEMLSYYLRKREFYGAALSILEPAVGLVGFVMLLAGTARFLRAWTSMGWIVSSTRGFLKESPEFERIRSQPDARTRWKMAGNLILRTLLLPGLGWVPMGVGIIVLAFQFLEPDRSLRPDPQTVQIGLVLVAMGVAQMATRMLLARRESS